METESQLTRLGLFDARVPRYTSYPTAPHFSAAITATDFGGWIADGISDMFNDKPDVETKDEVKLTPDQIQKIQQKEREKKLRELEERNKNNELTGNAKEVATLLEKMKNKLLNI